MELRIVIAVIISSEVMLRIQFPWPQKISLWEGQPWRSSAECFPNKRIPAIGVEPCLCHLLFQKLSVVGVKDLHILPDENFKLVAQRLLDLELVLKAFILLNCILVEDSHTIDLRVQFFLLLLESLQPL